MRLPFIALTGLLAMAVAIPGHAANLLLNGDFETTTLPGSNEFGSAYPTNQVADWNTDGYNFVFAAGTADTSGSVGQFNTIHLWGPNLGSNNGLAASSPAGGNFIAASPSYNPGAIEQIVNGLTIGSEYTVSFWWAAAQQYGWDGATYDNWMVSLGNESQVTETVNNPDHGFQPWRKENLVFTARSSTETLSFLAQGSPSGQPPFALLDGVTLSQVAVPEPSSWAMMLAGFGTIGMVLRGRRSPFRPRRAALPQAV